MIGRKALFTLLLPMAILLSGASGIQAQTDCKPYVVDVPILQVQKEADNPGIYITALQKGETVCMADSDPVGPQRYALAVHKIADGQSAEKIGGWASLLFMSPVAENAAKANKDSEPAATDTAVMSEEDILRFDEPVPYGPYQIRGKTLKELIEAKPMFAPIEGIPEELWSKNCSSCHKWNEERLCEQGKSYLPRAAEVFRHQHPFGGAYKMALMRWAKTGCK